ncbi:asialoglycoprotein receptor 1-like isoform X1 [Acipenser ruthenus]|uniref:asialoglycoprotein receptor 1-like isoform X1 n=1 Tax=Acipenser ruthenus TaxID=7906 RepID=UPI0027419EF2|nr:asialoglycoprotein receptor 1-like isoform X1 [Acipenser ruthenus]
MEMDSYESDQVYENVDIKQPPSRRAGAQHGALALEMNDYASDYIYANTDSKQPPCIRPGEQQWKSAAPVDSSDRQAASCGGAVWLLIALSCLLLAAGVALGVLYFKLSESHSGLLGESSRLSESHSGLLGGYSRLNDTLSELQRNYSRLSEYHSQLQSNYSRLSESHSQLQRNYGRVQDENSDMKKKIAAVCVKSSSKERVCKACPVNWVESNGKCYYFSPDKMDWHSSRSSCVSMGADLVIIESEAEQKFLHENAKKNYHWIGLTDAVTEGVWLWVDGTPLNDKAKFWYGNEPDDWKEVDSSGEDCAHLKFLEDPLKDWFDGTCRLGQYNRICETMAVIINI